MQNSNPIVEFKFSREVLNAGELRKVGDKLPMLKAVAERLKAAGYGDYAAPETSKK